MLPTKRAAPFAAVTAFISVMLGLSSIAEAASLKVTGGLPRNPSDGVEFTLEISGITEAQRTAIAADEDGEPFNNVKIVVTAIDDGALPFSADQAADPINLYLEQTDEAQIGEADDGTTTKDTFSLAIREGANGAGVLNDKFKDTDMVIEVTYEFGTTSIVSDKAATLTREIYVIKSAPAFKETAIEGTHKTLKVNWTHRTDAAIEGGTGTKEPTRTNVYLIRRDAAASLKLPAKTFVASGDGDTDAECDYTAPAADSGECVVCPANTYLDAAAIKAAGDFQVTSPQSSDESESVTGLENDTQYVAFLQWEPSGLGVSQCVVGVPNANLSLTEINGEGEARVVDFRCFIATAAYGSPLHQDVGLFRQFRDEVLMPSPLGRAAVAAYYRFSPPLADFIAKHPSARNLARWTLEIVADTLRGGDSSRKVRR